MRVRFAPFFLVAFSFAINTAYAQSSLPSGWSHRDIGAVGVAGSASYASGVFTVSGAGPSIYGTADGMHFVYQPMSGDGTIVARVLSVQGVRAGTNPEAGVMIRETLDANSTHVSSLYRNNPLVELMWRPGPGSNTSYANSSSATPLPYWVKMVRSGSTFSAYASPDGVAWTQVGATQTISVANMRQNVYVGLAVSSNDSNNNSLVTATFDNVSVTAASWAPPSAPWLDQDVGPVGVTGNAGYASGVFTVSGAGPSIWGATDGMHFVYQPLAGDGSIVARVLNVVGVRSGTNPAAGVMIRETSGANSTHISSVCRNNPMVELLWRGTTGGSTSYVNSGLTLLPYWLKVIRSGSTFSSYSSPDGVTWTQVGSSQTITMATNAYIGLAVSSEDSNNYSLVTATFDNVSVSTTAAPAPTISSVWPAAGVPGYDVLVSGSGFGISQGNSAVLLNDAPLVINYWSATSISATINPAATSGPLVVTLAPSMNSSNPATFKVLPAAWLDQDVGAVGVAGNASYGNSVFTVSGAGPSIWGTTDGMHFVYQPLSGDGTMVARVLSVQGMWSGTNPAVGVMIRETLSASSTHASSLYRINPLVELLWRGSTGGTTSFVNSGSTPLPYWVKVVRSGSIFSAFISSSGTTWTQVGSNQTINMATNTYIGLAVSSENSANSSLVTAAFDNVLITTTAAQAPAITDINPFSGPVGATVTISGANFGAQGASTATFNGVAAGPGVWTPTAITVPVPYGATTGNIVVKANGMNSNGVPFTVVQAPTITNLNPTSGAVGTPVTITGTNFALSQGSSTVAFAGVTAPTATNWSQTSIVVNVPNGAITGGVVVTVAGVPSNIVGFTVTSTAPSIASLGPASGPVSTSVTINGANFGTTTGTVTFYRGPRLPRVSAAITTWTANSIVVTVPNGAATGTVFVNANGVNSNPAFFTVYTVQTGTPTLIVNPGSINMVVGQTQAIQLLDQNGAPFSSPTWLIANPSIASIVPPINQGDPTLLQATAIGNTTLTGTSPDGRTGSAQVAILSGTSLPIGTVQWEIPSLSSSTLGIANIVQSLRIDDTTPDFYVLDWGANGGSGAFRALTADGQQKWMFTPSAPINEELALFAADDQGGFIYQRDDWSDLPMIGRVDENGNQSWLLSAPGIASNIAIHPDGTIYYVQQDYLNTGHSPTAVVVLDEVTGQMKFAIPIPTSTSTGADYTFLNDPNGGSGGDGYPATGGQYCTPGTSTAAPSTATVGNLSISSDGTVYLPIGTAASSYDALPCDSTPDPLHPGYPHLVKSTDGVSSLTSYLQVMAILPDGTYSLRQLDSASSSHSGNSSGSRSFGSLGTATPDGNGGTLLAIDNSGLSIPSIFYHDTGSVVTKLSLTFNPAGEILTGEDGTAYLAGANPSPSTTGAIVAINVVSNTINWADTLSSGSPQLYAIPGTGGAIFTDHSGHLNLTDSNGLVSPLFPGTGGTDAGPLNTSLATFRNPGTWLVIQSGGGLGAVVGNYTNLTATDRPMVNGDPQGQSAPSKADLELVWCANGACSDLPNNYTQDVAFYTQQPGPPLTKISFTPAQQKILTDSAWTALKQAFSGYNVNVGMGGSGLTPTNTAYVVGTISTNSLNCGLTAPLKQSWSWVFYVTNMTFAQIAINIQISNPTPAQLNQLAQAIGEGIGNNAAHEIAHELVTRYLASGKIVNVMDLDDQSLDTYNEGDCGGSTSPWVYTGSGNDGVHPGQTPIHWSPNADQSLANIYGRRQP